MNNRGKPLSQLELLKNRLIFLSTKLKNIEDYESITIRKVINDSWKAVYHYLGKNKDFPLNDDKFLETHFSIYFDRKKLFDEIDKKLLLGFHRSYEVQYFLLDMIFTIKNVKIDTKFLSEYVSSLKSSVKIWYYLHNPYDFTNLNEDEKLLFEKIDRIEIHNLKVIVLTAFLKFGNIESQERTSFLKTLEKFGFFLLLSPMKRVFVKDIEFGFFEAARNLYTGSENLNSLKNKMDKFLSESKNKPELLSSLKDFFKSNGFYEWDGIQYFLFEYELFLKSKSKSKKIKINWRDFNIDVDESNSIEHIYPQTATDIKWKLHFDKYTPRERKVICNSLGNLVALSKQKNSSLRNKPFEEKVSNDNNTVGYRYGCYSENEITRFDKWTAVQILARSLRLIKFMNETWDLTIGNNDLEKASFLNLEFVIQKESLVLTQENNIDFGDTFLNDYVLLKELNAFT
ncbi:MAG: HNH endonuclease [Saprospiraceae bacterium]|nr:HNH endonuclease [Saprospiraceae bacterium]